MSPKAILLCALTVLCTQEPLRSAEEVLKVVRVLDGDTFIVDAAGRKGHFQVIGLLGVDAPENSQPPMRSEPLGKEALEFTRDRLEGKKVVLEADPAGPDMDRYGRRLRTVRLKDEGVFNAAIVSQGFARVKEFPFEMDGLQLSRRAMAKYAREARDAGINYIGSCCGSVASHVREMARALGKPPAQDRAWRVDYSKPMSAYEYYEHHEQPPAARS